MRVYKNYVAFLIGRLIKAGVHAYTLNGKLGRLERRNNCRNN